MPSRRKRFLIAGLIAAVVAIVLVVRETVFRPGESIQATLSDGLRRVTFLQAGAGAFKYSSDSRVTSWLRSWLPNALAAKLPPLTSFSSSGNNGRNGSPQLSLLFRFDHVVDGQVVPTSNVEQAFSRFEFQESTGFTFSQLAGSSSSSNNLVAFHVDSFPRRDRTLHVRAFERGTEKPLFDFTIPNPGWSETFPEWRPESIPVSQTDEPITATLRSVSQRPYEGQGSYLVADVETTASVPAWRKNHFSYWFEDATGNCDPVLSPFEPAIRVHVLVHRDEDAEFTSSEAWALPAFAFAAPNSVQEINQKRTLDGVSVDVRYLSSAGRVRDEGGQITVSPPSSPGQSGTSTSNGSNFRNGKQVSYTEVDCGVPFIRVDMSPLPPNTELLTLVADQNGKPLKQYNTGTTHGFSGGSFRLVQFDPESDTETVSLKIIVNRARAFEFTVASPGAASSP